jgi:murein DD-endopeptidase MepM/ murein hydrolase activator NlpD
VKLDIGSVAAQLATSTDPGDAASLRRKSPEEAGRAFEGFLVQMLAKEMRRTVPEGLFGSQAMEIFAGVLDEEIAKRATEGAGLGLAKQIAAQISAMQPGLALPEATLSIGPLGHARLPVRGGRVSSAFGMRADPMHGRKQVHKGLDIAAPRGAEVRPVAAGTVVSVGERGGYGLTVEVDHGEGWTTLYAHCDSAGVTVGQRVTAEQTIATVGSTGRSTGPHLHLEVRQQGRSVDPREVFGWK